MFESPCPKCHGSGKCPHCHGATHFLWQCSACKNGDGKCPECGGTGNDSVPHFLGLEVFTPQYQEREKRKNKS